MKTSSLLLTFLLVSFLNAKGNINDDFFIGLTINSFDKVQQNRIKSSILKIEQEFSKLLDNKREAIIYFFENENKMLEEYKKYEMFSNAVFYSGFFLKNREEIKKYTKDFYAFSSKDIFHSYILAVNRKSNINSLKDLKGKKFVSYSSDENTKNWLDYLILKKFQKPYSKLISEEIEVKKSNRALLSLFFNKADFTVIKKSVYEDMLLLNPSLKKKIKILIESEKNFLFGIGVFHKKASNNLIKSYYESLSDEKLSKELVQVYKLLDQSSIQKISKDDLKKLEDFYDKYMKLKKKYGN